MVAVGGFSMTFLALVVATVFFGGAIRGVAGFGYEIAGTAVLTTFLDPSEAVAVMIIPLLTASVSLVGELEASELKPCVARFWLYILTAVVGTVLGMVALGAFQVAPLKLGIGVVTLVYVASKQGLFDVPGIDRLRQVCFTEGTVTKASLGLVSGFLFGATNVSVQVVEYLDSLELDRSTFVGVLSMILVGLSTARVGIAWLLNLYGSVGLFAVSVVAALPGIVGVRLGTSVRRRLPDRLCEVTGAFLLAVVGVWLVLVGAGGV
ncbi:MAG: sulfite exporter TauE/SafE family protein [Halobacteriales archaeon]|nr:sulfite exporter TauE/SafE family protein [Halobacteriales archaeon]